MMPTITASHRSCASQVSASRRSTTRVSIVCSVSKGSTPNESIKHSSVDTSKRSMLAALVASGMLAAVAPPASKATALQELARGFIRPDMTPVEAVVVLMDAKSTLKEIAEIAATAQDSQVRFVSRKLWPAFAKTLREVGPAAPVAAGIISGSDSEATLSEQYGGKAGEQPGLADRVYIGLGNVLTISGRTIKPEAQASPVPANDARAAIEEFLAKVPESISKEAQDFRIQRAALAAA